MSNGEAGAPDLDPTAAVETPREQGEAPDEFEARRAVLAGLSELIDRLGRSPSHTAPPASRRNAVTAFKGTWSRLRAEQRLRQALAQVPAMAGPLNSSHVINRTLQTMRDLSPEYLDSFMLHVDALLWLEHASGAGARAVRKA